ESLLVLLGAWHTDARAIHCQWQPTSDAPMLSTVLLHEPVKLLPQERQQGRGPSDQRLEQALVGAHGTSSEHVERPAMGLGECSGQGGVVRPHPDDRQQNQIDDVPCGIAMQLQLRSEDTRLNSSHSQISYAVFCLKKKKRKK